jgi:hypothetical protein
MGIDSTVHQRGDDTTYCKFSALDSALRGTTNEVSLWLTPWERPDIPESFELLRESQVLIIPTKVGIQITYCCYRSYWIPSCDGMMKLQVSSAFLNMALT